MIFNRHNFSKLTWLVIMIFLSMFFDGKAQEKSGDLISRKDIDPKYTWNLEDIYTSVEAWEKDFSWIESSISKYKNFEGRLGESGQVLLDFLKFDEEVGIKLGRLMRYASLAKDLDLNNVNNQGLYDRSNSLSAKLMTAGSFLRPEVLAIPEATLEEWMNNVEGLGLYKLMFDNILRRKVHTLPKEMEELMSLAAPVTDVPYNVFSYMKNADIQYPTVKDTEGNDVQLSDGRYYAGLQSTDKDYRKRVYKGYYEPYKAATNTYAALFNGNLKALEFNAKARKYESARASALDANNIPLSVYDNLVNSVNENLAPLHRWAGLKKKVLGLDELHPYDSYVTLFPSVTKEYTYDEGIEMLSEALKPLGEDYLKSLRMAFDNRWIDVYETKGKRSGAYSSGVTFGFHPYVLLNWNNTLSDVFTFAHEMGHNMHSYYTEQNQPYAYADYSIFVAEVASTMNEALLLDYLLEKATTKEEKLALIQKELSNIQATFYRQTRFAEYEQLVNELNEKGEALTPDKLSKLFGEMYQKYWGDEMVVDEEEYLSWARIPHFYYNFYVYQYATSYAASMALAQKVKKEGQPAIDKFLTFLKSGSSKYPIDVLIAAGVDMTTPDPIMAVVNRMNELLDKMEALLAE